MTAPVTIGDLRHRVSIEVASRASDGGGGANLNWTNVADVWASLSPRSGAEVLILDRVAGAVSYDIWMRYRADVVPAMRIRFGTRTFDIRAVLDTQDRGHWLKCVCEERDL